MLELFLTGIRPKSGKTFVTAGLAATMQSLGYSTCVYKPVVTGALEKDGYVLAPDLVYVKNADKNITTYCSYLLKSSNLPCFAAQEENKIIEKDVIFQDYYSVVDEFECLLVNGVDGLAIPYGKDFYEENIVQTLNLPLLLVASPIKSSLSDIIMTINQAQSKNIHIRGVILNDCPFHTDDINIKSLPNLIEQHTDARVLGLLPHIPTISKIKPEDMIGYILGGVDIESVFDVRIAKLR